MEGFVKGTNQITLKIQETIGLIGTKSEIRMTHGLDGTNNETTRNGLDLTEINVTLNAMR